MVATIKIIPFAVPGAALERAGNDPRARLDAFVTASFAAPIASDLTDLRRHDAERVALRLRGACVVAGHTVADVTISIDRTAVKLLRRSGLDEVALPHQEDAASFGKAHR